MTREEAKEALSVLKIYDAQWLREAVDMAIEALSERPKGEWIQDPSYIGVSDVPICSNCRKRPPRIECGGKLIGGYGAEATGSVWQSEFKYHRSDFCPNCGADMRGEEV